MVDKDNSKPKKIPKRTLYALRFFLLIAVIIFIRVFFGESTESKLSSQPAPQPKIDSYTKYSCVDWLKVIGEGSKGVNTEAEIRAGIAKVYELARFSQDADIVESATRQLATITAGDIDGFAIASTDFGNACKKYGAL